MLLLVLLMVLLLLLVVVAIVEVVVGDGGAFPSFEVAVSSSSRISVTSDTHSCRPQTKRWRRARKGEKGTRVDG